MNWTIFFIGMITVMLLFCCYVYADKIRVFVFKKLHFEKLNFFENSADKCVFPSIISFKNTEKLSRKERQWLERLQNIRTEKKQSLQNSIWFGKNVNQFCRSGAVLAFINAYKDVQGMFWQSVTEPQQNLEFQLLLISVFPSSYGGYCRNYNHLLYDYLTQYELLPQVLEIVMTDRRFSDVKRVYECVQDLKS